MKPSIALMLGILLGSTAVVAQQRPAFRGGVDLISVDVQVVTSNGQPIAGLGPEKFEVSINGRRRRVVSAELVRHDTASSASPAGPRAAAPQFAGQGASVQPQPPSEGRVFIIAIDLLSFRPGATQSITSAAREFIQKLQPNDLVGLAAFPAGPEIDASTDHASVIGALEKVVGVGEPAITAANRFGLNPHNIVDITAAAQIEPWVDISAAPPNSNIRRVGMAVCTYDRDPVNCARWIVSDAQSLAVYEEGLAIQRLGALRALLGALARAPGRKTVVFVSAGFPATDVPGGRPNLGELGLLVGQEAARANTTIYSLHVDSRRTEMASAETGRQQRPTDNQLRDSAILGRPLDQVSGLSGGALFTVVQGGGEFAFDRVRSETSSLYMLGVEPDEADRTGVPRQLNVRVNSGQRGSIVRARSWVVIPKPGSAQPVRASAPAPPTSTPEPRVATVALNAEDVAAYERLWRGGTPAPTASNTSVVPARSTPPDVVTPFDRLYEEYAAGRSTVVLERLQTTDDFERYRPDMVARLGQWKKEWSAKRAAFAFELALAAYARRWPNPRTFLSGARDIVLARPDVPGTKPADDAFEMRFHRAAVALVAALEGPHGVDGYLASIQHRVALANSPPAGAVLTDPHLVLAQAMAGETQTLMLLLSVGSRRDDPFLWVAAKDDGRARRQLEEVERLLVLAQAHQDTRAEASVRRAFILHRLGDHQAALALLEAATPVDDVVDYWRALIQGRVLLALSRQQEAITALERASTLAPDAQTPAVALTTIFLKLGDRDQTLGWAERARTTTQNSGDPWPLYWAGSSRFLTRWLTDLREARQ